MEVQQAIKEVGTLYRVITGSELPEIKEPVQRIPPERDPEEYVQGRFSELIEAARRLTGRASPMHEYSAWTPRIDAVETAEEWRIEIEVPRVPLKELSVHLKSGCLIVRGRRAEHQGVTVRWSEIPRGSFTRSLQLPAGVDGGRSEAILRAGVLTVRLPKGQAYAETERRIEIEQLNT